MDELKTYVFMRKDHPLANRDTLSLTDLQDYPFVTYDQEETPNYVLNVRWIEEARYGGRCGDNGNYIILTVASGKGAAGRGEALYDDEL